MHSIPITIPIATTAESQNARAQDNLAYAEHQTALELKTLQMWQPKVMRWTAVNDAKGLGKWEANLM